MSGSSVSAASPGCGHLVEQRPGDLEPASEERKRGRVRREQQAPQVARQWRVRGHHLAEQLGDRGGRARSENLPDLTSLAEEAVELRRRVPVDRLTKARLAAEVVQHQGRRNARGGSDLTNADRVGAEIGEQPESRIADACPRGEVPSVVC